MADQGEIVGTHPSAREWARRSLMLSAWAWGIFGTGVVLAPLLGARARLVPLVAAIAVPLAFAVLTVRAVRAARRGRGSGEPISTWAGVVAALDVVAAVAQVGGVVLFLWIVWGIYRCDQTPGCQLFTF